MKCSKNMPVRVDSICRENCRHWKFNHVRKCFTCNRACAECGDELPKCGWSFMIKTIPNSCPFSAEHIVSRDK